MADTDHRDTSSGDGAASEATVMKTVQSLGAVLGPTALITALLFYFGYTKVATYSREFGLDVSLFGMSTQDYLLQSIRSVFVPAGTVLIGGLGLLWVHKLVVHQIELRPDRSLWRSGSGLLAAVGVVLFLIGMVWNYDRTKSDALLVLTPLTLMAGVGLFSYAVLVDRRRRRFHRPVSAGAPSLPGLSVILVAVLLAVGVVWVTAEYAGVKGREEARFDLDQLPFNPGVVVYSPKSLNIGADGVTETKLDQPDSTYGYRYDGLKLLCHSNGRYFLIPETWSPDGGRTVVLRDDDQSLRLEFVHAA